MEGRWLNTTRAQLINGKNYLTVSSAALPGCDITIHPGTNMKQERLGYTNNETDLNADIQSWSTTSSPTGCWNGNVSFLVQVALTPAVKYIS
jgi:hypothetical protein